MQNRINVKSRALDFARTAHAGQVRKYTGHPYITHCIQVADILIAHGIVDDKIIAAAYLHDVLEDTKTTERELERQFGPIVTSLVLQVTDISKPEHGNRAVRKEIDRQHISRATEYGQWIKIADLISNAMTIDAKFARVYLEEKARLLDVIKTEHPILQSAKGVLIAGQTYINSAVAGMDGWRKGLSDSVLAEVNKRLASKPPVTLYHNDEAGQWWWSVADGEFWLNSFDTEAEARKFCEDNQLPIVGVIDHA